MKVTHPQNILAATLAALLLAPAASIAGDSYAPAPTAYSLRRGNAGRHEGARC